MNTTWSIGLVATLCAAGCAHEEQKLSSSSPEALAAYAEGVRLTQNFYLTEAGEAFEKALSHDSSFGMAWARLAIVEGNARNDVEAKEHMQHALHNLEGATRAEQLFIRMWDSRIRFDNSTAARLADSLIALQPRDPEPYVFRGEIHELFQHVDSAILMYRTASDLDTAFAPAAMMLGYAYSSVNEQANALSYMGRYIRLVPNAADPRASYADLLLRVGRYDAALEQYRESLRLKPDYWYAINQIGNLYRLFGRLRAAGTQYDEGFRHMPQSDQLEAARIAAHADLALRAGRYREAMTMFEQSLDGDSTNLSAALGLFVAYLESGNTAMAAMVLDNTHLQLERLNLLESQAMLGYYVAEAKLHTEKQGYGEARTSCERALEFSTPLTRPVVFRQLAEIAIKDGSLDDAFDACEEALSINQNSPEALLTLTKVYAALGDSRMTNEIGGRLLVLWKDADADFVQLQTLHQLLSRSIKSAL